MVKSLYVSTEHISLGSSVVCVVVFYSKSKINMLDNNTHRKFGQEDRSRRGYVLWLEVSDFMGYLGNQKSIQEFKDSRLAPLPTQGWACWSQAEFPPSARLQPYNSLNWAHPDETSFLKSVDAILIKSRSYLQSMFGPRKSKWKCQSASNMLGHEMKHYIPVRAFQGPLSYCSLIPMTPPSRSQ